MVEWTPFFLFSIASGFAIDSTHSYVAFSQINILETIADALYSDAENVVDAVSDLVDTLLQLDSRDANLALGITIAQSVMNGESTASFSMLGGGWDPLMLARKLTEVNEKARIDVLSELVTAVGLQRFRFAESQNNGETKLSAEEVLFLSFFSSY